MALLTAKTKGGADWTPEFIEAIDPAKCIGCGRCYKACTRGVLGPDDFEDEDDMIRLVMTVVNADDCIGCTACSKACAKGCISFTTIEI
jgi:Nif-specific ferredoxin III